MTQASTGTLQFVGDWDAERRYDCIGFDETWNGWAAPIVSIETLKDLIDESPSYFLTFALGAVAIVESIEDDENVTSLHPDTAGNYHLRELGWTMIDAADLEDGDNAENER